MSDRRNPQWKDEREHWDRRANTYPVGIDAAEEEILSFLMENTSISEKTILDIGCGPGRFSAALLQRGAARVVGIDLSPNMLRRAHRYMEQKGISRQFLSICSPWEVCQLPQSIQNVDCAIAIHSPAADSLAAVWKMVELVSSGVLIVHHLSRHDSLEARIASQIRLPNVRRRRKEGLDVICTEMRKRGKVVRRRLLRREKEHPRSPVMVWQDYERKFCHGQAAEYCTRFQAVFSDIVRDESFHRRVVIVDEMVWIGKNNKHHAGKVHPA